MREAKRPLLVVTVILVFLSIFTKSQASSPFEALNSRHLSKSQIDVRPAVLKRFPLFIWLLFAVSSVSNFPLTQAGGGGLLFRFASAVQSKAPLEVLVESWLTSSVEVRESFSSPDDMGCTDVSSSCSNEIDDPLYLRRLSQGVSRRS